VPKTDIDKLRLFHSSKGSRVLDDPLAEKVAYLLSNPTTAGDVTELLGVTDEQIDDMKGDVFFVRRLAFLSARNNRPKQPTPKTPAEYRDWALRRLHRIAIKAKNEKDQVSACKVLGIIAGELAKEKPQESVATSADGAALEDLRKAFGGTK